MLSMATGEEDCCPICLGPCNNVECTMPCLHRFCFSCIQQWMDIRDGCPVCRSTVMAIRHSLRGDQFQEVLLSGLQPEAEAREESPLDYSLEWWGGLSPADWAELFQRYPHLCTCLRPWFHQELGCHFWEDPQQVLMLMHMILCTLPVIGLNEDSLAEQLQDYLQSLTRSFMHDLIEYAVQQNKREAHYFLVHGSGMEDSLDGSQDSLELSPVPSTSWASLPHSRELSPVASTSWAASQGGSPVPVPDLSCGAAAEDTDQLRGTSTAALRGSCGCTPSIPIAIPGEQDQDLELKEAATGAPAPSQGQSCSHQGPRCPLKRKPSSSEDSAPPSKKPPQG